MGGTNGHNKIKNASDNLTRTKEKKKAQVIDRKKGDGGGGRWSI